MSRKVWITGVGTITASGVGIEPLWADALAGTSRLARIEAFDPSGFTAQIGGEVRDFKANKVVPKHYRKAVKVMARDIELAVGAADAAVRSAGLTTPGTDAEAGRTYPGERTGCHIGAGLIAAELNELTEALVTARTADGKFDIHAWGREGMQQLTPLWLLKYLPNMLACHVTIIHDAQGPSNTITCAEASSGLSIGESLRVIQRGNADLCYCGGAESKLNPMTFYRQVLTGRLNTESNDDPTGSVRPFDQGATGMVIGEGGGIVTLEAEETAKARGATPYAALLGFGASQTVNRAGDCLRPDAAGVSIGKAIHKALGEAGVAPGDVDAIVGFGSGAPGYDTAEAAALSAVFGEALAKTPLRSVKPIVGMCGAGAGGVDVAIAAVMIQQQKLPAVINCTAPLEGLNCANADAADAKLNHVLVYSPSLGGQNVALVLGKA